MYKNIGKSTIAAILATLFLGVMFMSLFHMSVGMDMSTGMVDCPFASSQETLCTMTMTDHVEMWKSVFLSIAPAFALLLTGAVMLIVFVFSNRVLKRQYIRSIQSNYIREKNYTFSYRPLQELFSNGILHPKLF